MNTLDKAIFEYHNNLSKSVVQICKDNDISTYDLYKNLDYKEPNRYQKKSIINTWDIEKFIEDSPEKYYWLGFIAADGYISHRGLRIDIKDIDYHHLEKFKTFVDYSGEIKRRINNSGCHTCYIDLNSTKLETIFAKYNIVSNKSLIFTIPEDKIPSKYLLDFCRGMIDGDGCIRINNHQQISLSFCSGNKECVEQMNTILGVGNKVSFSGQCYRFQVTGNKKAKQILDVLYKNSKDSTRLDRKYNIYYNKFYREEEVNGNQPS